MVPRSIQRGNKSVTFTLAPFIKRRALIRVIDVGEKLDLPGNNIDSK